MLLRKIAQHKKGSIALKLYKEYNEGLFLLTSYVVLEYDSE